MNMFGFLDNLVKGSVYFLIALLLSVGTLIAHPLSGSARLYRRERDKSRPQITSTTFLAVALIVIGAVFAGDVVPKRAAAANATATGLTAWLTTGKPLEGFAPIVAGSVLAAALIVLMLRAVARIARLNERRRERFQAAVEYQLGLLFLAMALLNLWDMVMTEETKGGLADALILPLLLLAFVALGAHFWIGLLRITNLHRLRRRMPRVRRRWTRRRRGEAGAERSRQGGNAGPSPAAALLLAAVLGLAVLPVAAIPPFLIGAAGLRAGSTVTKWLLRQESGEKAAAGRRG
jgi:hypothetical protein